MNCTGPEPKVQFHEQGKWYRVADMSDRDKTIEIHDQDDVQSHLESNLRNKVSPFLHNINVTRTPSLVKCKHEPSPVSPSDFLYKFDNISCKGYNLYFYADDDDRNVPSLPKSLSNLCSVVRLPTSVKPFELCLATENPTAWDGYFTIQWTVWSACEKCHDKGGRCLNKPDRTFKCGNLKKGGTVTRKIGISIAVSLSGAGILVIIIFSIYFTRMKANNSFLPWRKKAETTIIFEAFLKNHGSLALKRFSFKEVKTMTNHFRDKLGQGGYGSVFKGNLKDGSSVAVKVLNESKGNGEEFINEVASISKTSHVNIVSLLGYCFEESKRALIYEFMPNGSLENYIYNETQSGAHSNLGWETFYQVSVGIARGLEYLHRGCSTRILHFDIKPHNILLDQDFCPKISDFGMAKLCPRKESIISMMGARGTAGYIAPEVFNRNFGGVSHKSDVYSYGMMILEMAGGRKNIKVDVAHTSEIYFPNWIYSRIESDKTLEIQGAFTEAERVMARKMILVGLWCIQTSPSDRPSMSRVLEMLESNLEALPIPPKPYLSSPTRVKVGPSSNSQ